MSIPGSLGFSASSFPSLAAYRYYLHAALSSCLTLGCWINLRNIKEHLDGLNGGYGHLWCPFSSYIYTKELLVNGLDGSWLDIFCDLSSVLLRWLNLVDVDNIRLFFLRIKTSVCRLKVDKEWVVAVEICMKKEWRACDWRLHPKQKTERSKFSLNKFRSASFIILGRGWIVLHYGFIQFQ